jgi:zinc transport system permease protein
MSFITWLDDLVRNFSQLFPPGTFLSSYLNVKGLLAVILIGLICGAIGSLVVGNRMAFFSDALSHCAFAGVSLGLLVGLALEVSQKSMTVGLFYQIGIPLIMIGFGALVGLGIAFVREKTSLASDTVIGVFFAGALGFGAILMGVLSNMGYFNVEQFVFGAMVTVGIEDLLALAVLGVITAGVLALMYNQFVFTSFNPSLARSRRIPVRLCNYLFIVLLALIVNLCLKVIGALLINALLVVPAATASNVCRNMRQLFWTTVLLCLGVGVLGHWLSWDGALLIQRTFGLKQAPAIGTSGAIVVLSVVLFFLSMLWPPLRDRWDRRKHAAAGALPKT